jgi:hypothetical protein
MGTKANRLCPFLNSPLPKCYCLRSESIWAVRVVECCAGRFELCEYYRMHCSQSATEEGDVPAEANGADVVARPSPGRASDGQPIPIQMFGKTIEIHKAMTRSDAKAMLPALIKDEPSVDTAERLQYSVILAPGGAPVAILFDFDRKGIVTNVTLDSRFKEGNPSVATLVNWLRANGGKPAAKKEGSETWIFGGWKIDLFEGDSGEDAVYRIEITRLP